MHRYPNPKKELRKKSERLEKYYEKAYNDLVREKILKDLEKMRKELNEINRDN